jgi:tetratricopeptide (TPR) repeat protein
MRRLLLSTIVVMVWTTVPAFADDERDCFQQADLQLRIKGCSDTIQRNPDDATAYHHRAVAYGLAGDLDHAIADYSKTIEISPDNSAAYENRGRAYASKGDYTRALADVMKANELVAKFRPAAIPATPWKITSIPAKIVIPPKALVTAPKTKPVQQASHNVAEPASGAWPAWAISFRHRSAD